VLFRSLVRHATGRLRRTSPRRRPAAITAKEAELEAKEAKLAAEAILNTTQQPFLVLDHGLHVRSANRAFFEAFHVKQGDTLGQSILEMQSGRWRLSALKGDLDKLLSEKSATRQEYEYQDPSGEGRIRMTACRVDREDGRPIQILLTFYRTPGL